MRLNEAKEDSFEQGNSRGALMSSYNFFGRKRENSSRRADVLGTSYFMIPANIDIKENYCKFAKAAKPLTFLPRASSHHDISDLASLQRPVTGRITSKDIQDPSSLRGLATCQAVYAPEFPWISFVHGFPKVQVR